MFQLIDFLASQFAAVMIGALQDTIYLIALATDCDECGFNDLGKLLFGGLVLAVIVGVAISVLRRNAGRSDTSDFVTIRSFDKKK